MNYSSHINNIWKYIIYTQYIFCSYRMEQAMINPFQRDTTTTGLSNELRIHKKIIYAVDIHRKGIESVFNQNMTLDNNYFCNSIYLYIFSFIISQKYLCLRLCNIFKSDFEGSFFLLILSCVICLSLNLYGVSI